jgi:hypothetical protein
MPFILFENDDGFTNPQFRCDLCDRHIADASEGLLLWDPRTRAGQFAPKILCKNCEHKNSALYRSDPASMELDVAIVYLLKSSGITTEEKLTEICRRAALLSSIR